MALIKHVVGEDGIGVNIEMSPQEEAEFLATLPEPIVPAAPREPTKAELLQHIAAKIEALA